MLRWSWERVWNPPPPDPPATAIPGGVPRPAVPRASPDEIRITWVGHATFLIQIGSLNLLTDPVFSERATPVSRLGPRRLVPPALRVEDLPPIDLVILSHSHYDHLDAPSVDRLRDRFGDALEWITPLGYEEWFRDRDVTRVRELDWWESTSLSGPTPDGKVPHAGPEGPDSSLPDPGTVRVTACPAQHWCRRGLRTNERLWASFALRTQGGHALYFGGDSGYFKGYREIGARLGPFHAALLPIGAYEPRWFMKTSHMNPKEAVRAYRDLGGTGGFIGMHWGTFRLTDEAVLEPPARTRSAWADAGLSDDDLHLPGVGGTVELGRVRRS
jgi:N-acyl-phosphatidylethanolamine-hydrolysing phospholipase D